MVGLWGLEPGTFGPPDHPPGCPQLKRVDERPAQLAFRAQVEVPTGPELTQGVPRRADIAPTARFAFREGVTRARFAGERDGEGRRGGHGAQSAPVDRPAGCCTGRVVDNGSDVNPLGGGGTRGSQARVRRRQR